MKSVNTLHQGKSILKVALIANESPPYRIPIFNRIAGYPGIDFRVMFCCAREPNRFWNLPPMEFDHLFMRDRIATVNGRYIHNNPEVIKHLQQFSPDVVLTNGFNPTHLYAFAYALVKRIAFVPMTDGTAQSESTLSFLHKIVRKVLYARADAYVYASLGGRDLYSQYRVQKEHTFQSHLCADNSAFNALSSEKDKRYDFIFCGRIEPAKNPTFALEVAAEVAKRLCRKTRMLFVGSGSQLEAVKNAAGKLSNLIEVDFHGFARQEELPALYHSARIFLFPTLWDVWGVVANEACAAGVPVIVSKFAGAAGELVLHQQNGYVCDLDVNAWASNAINLLTQPLLWQSFSTRSMAMAKHYTFDAAAAGIIDACHHAAKRRNQVSSLPSSSMSSLEKHRR